MLKRKHETEAGSFRKRPRKEESLLHRVFFHPDLNRCLLSNFSFLECTSFRRLDKNFDDGVPKQLVQPHLACMFLLFSITRHCSYFSVASSIPRKCVGTSVCDFRHWQSHQQVSGHPSASNRVLSLKSQ